MGEMNRQKDEKLLGLILRGVHSPENALQPSGTNRREVTRFTATLRGGRCPLCPPQPGRLAVRLGHHGRAAGVWHAFGRPCAALMSLHRSLRQRNIGDDDETRSESNVAFVAPMEGRKDYVFRALCESRSLWILLGVILRLIFVLHLWR